VDLPAGQVSGLVEAVGLLEGIEGIRVVRFSRADVVRHPLVAAIIQAYESRPAPPPRSRRGALRPDAPEVDAGEAPEERDHGVQA
jgi:phosphate starvation-inducible protein PhoH